MIPCSFPYSSFSVYIITRECFQVTSGLQQKHFQIQYFVNSILPTVANDITDKMSWFLWCKVRSSPFYLVKTRPTIYFVQNRNLILLWGTKDFVLTSLYRFLNHRQIMMRSYIYKNHCYKMLLCSNKTVTE